MPLKPFNIEGGVTVSNSAQFSECLGNVADVTGDRPKIIPGLGANLNKSGDPADRNSQCQTVGHPEHTQLLRERIEFCRA
ncbi:hypothetical protein ACVJ5M_008810 [Bradyrhizobium sp. S3.7.6]